MKKRFLSLLLAALMIVTMLPGTALAKTLDTTSESGTNWSWIAESKTLTLSGYTDNINDKPQALKLPAGSTIVLTAGTSNAIHSNNGWVGIYCEGDLTITGSGSLTVSTDGKYNSDDASDNIGAGIYAKGILTIKEGAKVTAISSDTNKNSCAQVYGICGKQSVNITGGACVTAIAQNASWKEKNWGAYCIYSEGNIFIDNASVDAKCKNEGSEAMNHYAGIYSKNGSVTIQNIDSSQSVSATSGVSQHGNNYGIYGKTGVTIKNASRVTAVSKKAGANSGDSLAISAGENANILIENSNVEAHANGHAEDFAGGIYANTGGKITIKDSTVVATAGGADNHSCGICQQGTAADSLVIENSTVTAYSTKSKGNHNALHVAPSLNYDKSYGGYQYKTSESAGWMVYDPKDSSSVAYTHGNNVAYFSIKPAPYVELNYDLNYAEASPRVITVGAVMESVTDWAFMTDENYYKKPLSDKLTRTGYNFLGWAETADGDLKYPVGSEESNLITLTAGTPRTLYAVWEPAYTYTLIYGGNGGSWTTGTGTEATTETSKTVSTKSDNAGPVEDWKFNSETAEGIAYPGDPQREGHTFLGWAENATDTTPRWSVANASTNTIDLTANSPKTIYAVWQLNTTTVTINYKVKTNGDESNTAGGSVSPTSDTVTDVGTDPANGSTATANAGYTFEEWTDLDGKSVSTDLTFAPSRDSEGRYTADTYFACFSANTDTTYKVEHYKQNLDGTYPDTATETENKTGTTNATATAAPKTYTEFELDTAADGYLTSGTIVGDGTLVLKLYYKRNQYTVTFVDEDGTNVLKEGQYPYGTSAARVSAEAPTATKDSTDQYTYTFAGWTPTITDVTDTATYKATYTTSDRKYNLTYDGNGGSVETGTSVTDKVKYGEKDLRTTSPFSHDGTSDSPSIPIVWFGWSTADNYEKVYTKDDTAPASVTTVNITGNTTVYALWGEDTNGNDTADVLETKYTLTYNANGGNADTMPTDTTRYLSTNKATLKTYGESETRPGHADEDGVPVVFIGWSGAAQSIYSKTDTIAGGTIIASVTFSNENITVYAVWGYDTNGNGIADVLETKYTVTYESADYTSLDKKVVHSNLLTGEAIPDAPPVTANSGYRLGDWKLTSGKAGAGNTIGEDDLVYMLTVDSVYTLTFDANDGTFAEGKKTLEVESINKSDVTIDVKAPTREGYNFLGWATTRDANSATYPKGKENIYNFGNDHTARLYAVWQKHAFIDLNGTPENAESGTVYLSIQKELKVLGSLKEALTFRVKLVEVNGQLEAIEDGTTLTGSVTMNAGGTASFTFDGQIVLKEAAKKWYLISEIADNENTNVTFDDGKYVLCVVVDSFKEGNNGFEEGGRDLIASAAIVAADEIPDNEGVHFPHYANYLKRLNSVTATFTNTWTGIRPILPIVSGKATVKVEGLNADDHVAYVVGRGNNRFVPYGTVTRAETATMFFRLLEDDFRNYYWDDSASYADVKSSDWFHVAVATLEAAGIIQDTPTGGSFRPNEPITRAEMAVMAAQFCKVSGKVGSSSFLDVSSSHWAADEIAVVQYAGFIQGFNGYYRPDDTITRAECVTIINRMLERGAEAKNMLPGMVTFTDVTADAWYYEAVQEAANSHTWERTGFLMTDEQFFGEVWRTLEKAPDWAALEQLWAANR